MKIKVLFICSANCDRSPTAEAIYKEHPRLETKSTGIYRDDKNIETGLRWANVIVVMEHHHEDYIRNHFSDILADKPLYILDITDHYVYMEKSLVDVIQKKMDPILTEILREMQWR